ncbi:MAG TPA: hypothetical protein P5239_03870 [Victivallales bacterium]|nr:hypothetical protein [Victivallales bacterium]HRU00817.1 hypothetical protein [Victivallales bacterium]
MNREKNEQELDKNAEIQALKNENSILRKEIADVLLKNKILEDEKRKLELGLLTVFPEADKLSLSDRELQMLKDMLLLRDAVRKLAESKNTLVKDLEAFLKAGSPEEVVLKAKISVALDGLSKAIDNLLLLMEASVEKPNLSQCSVVDIDNKNKIITLSAGSSEGAFCGLYLTAKDDKEICAVIISVRPFSSAAMLLKGEIEKILPGMIFIPGKVK